MMRFLKALLQKCAIVTCDLKIKRLVCTEKGEAFCYGNFEHFKAKTNLKKGNLNEKDTKSLSTLSEANHNKNI